MMISHRLLAIALMLGCLCLLPGNARAETYNTCAGFIDSLPATINTQGVWCLRKDLATGMTSGNAITVNTNNVTIDCNDFKIGGLSAGNASLAYGIYANDRQSVTVRHCNVRGFRYGIQLNGGAGHLVEDNRLESNLFMGISVVGDNNLVQRNRVYDTGGYTQSSNSYGIYAYADVIENTVAGVFAVASNTSPYGILSSGSGYEVRGNKVRRLAVAGSGSARGIYVGSAGTTVADNRISATALTAGQGIEAAGADTFCTGNTVVNFTIAYSNCARNLDNLSIP